MLAWEDASTFAKPAGVMISFKPAPIDADEDLGYFGMLACCWIASGRGG
jgi:hypothetical protein